MFDNEERALALRAAAIMLVLLVAIILLPALVFVKQPGYGLSGEAVTPIKREGLAQHSVFIGGAVEAEGYYTIDAHMTYAEVFALAGLHALSYIPLLYADSYVDFSAEEFIVGYYQNSDFSPSINIESADVNTLVAAGIDASTATAIAAAAPYLKSKDELAGLIGSEKYQEVFYKLYLR